MEKRQVGKFMMRTLSLAAIVICIVGYNSVLADRAAAEEQAKAEYEEQLAELGMNTNAGKYKDGTYSGSAQGYGGTVEMSVTIKDGNISSVDVISAANEDAAYWNAAVGLTENVIAAQSVDIDVVSGATFSSNGLLGAVSEALEKATTD